MESRPPVVKPQIVLPGKFVSSASPLSDFMDKHYSTPSPQASKPMFFFRKADPNDFKPMVSSCSFNSSCTQLGTSLFYKIPPSDLPSTSNFNLGPMKSASPISMPHRKPKHFLSPGNESDIHTDPSVCTVNNSEDSRSCHEFLQIPNSIFEDLTPTTPKKALENPEDISLFDPIPPIEPLKTAVLQTGQSLKRPMKLDMQKFFHNDSFTYRCTRNHHGRIVLTPEQCEVFEREFRENPFLTQERKANIAIETNLKEEQVVTKFRNMRLYFRNLEADEENGVAPIDPVKRFYATPGELIKLNELAGRPGKRSWEEIRDVARELQLNIVTVQNWLKNRKRTRRTRTKKPSGKPTKPRNESKIVIDFIDSENSEEDEDDDDY
ncbi:unnamed protein product [Caenorhabditis brenneri]